MGQQKQTITVVYWNIWERTQLSDKKIASLLTRLDKIIEIHQPDVFGLTEILKKQDSNESPVLNFLEERGYKTTYAEFSPHKEKYFFGCAVASKLPMKQIENIILGPNRTAVIRGYKGHYAKLITTKLSLPNGGEINFVVTHLAHLALYNMLGPHQKHLKTFRQELSKTKYSTRTIAGGDLNEPPLLPMLWNNKKRFKRKSGKLGRPTWTHHGKPYTPLRANYDHILWSADDSIKLKKYKVLGRQPSDHTPLLAVFEID